ncbi:caspase recruitment domain-containing protein 6 [Nycticebus coucang]|uniref:caspase recruitment domain-containing protein 6 n=1 Tax=Nycticebus coucang TaxID=9470 RepID=UPI00234E14F4|nr:caspase recruitment domain-containing protein 6 [Nycticebus coucang]
MAAESVPSEIIEREQKTLLEILQQDPDSVLDTLTSWRLISEEEFETLEHVTDPLKKSQKLLILIQRKGEVTCQQFFKCLFSTFPESTSIWGLRHEILKHENVPPPPSIGVSKNSERAFSSEKKQPENPEITVSFKEKEHLALENFRETSLSSLENEKGCNTPIDTLPYSFENVEYEVPATITYLRDGQRYEEPDDSLYLGDDYLESVSYSEETETTVEEEDYDAPEYIVYEGEEDSDYSETTGFSDEEQNYEDSETGISLEEEEEEEEKSMEERRKVFKDILSCLNMDRSRKLFPDCVKKFSLEKGCEWTPETPGDLVWNFLMKVQALDVTARDPILRHKVLDEDNKREFLTGLENLEIQDTQYINPLDVLCASMLCSDSSLQQEIMSNMYQCQFALPLLLPDAENNKSILMLGAMKDIVKKPSTRSSGEPIEDTDKFLTCMKMPVISFVRLGHCSFSKSRILNRLFSPAQRKSHRIFLHQDSPALVLPRQISDGLVEITWCFPDSDDLKENPSVFQKPIAVTNLRGDLEGFWTQFGFLMEVSSAVIFFTSCLGEKEWNLLMFLGEAAIARCYFILSSQASESEETQIFQRILKLKPSQLLIWESEEAEDARKNMEGLLAALQEVMSSSSLRCVSMEDMASLARELGIQVDQDFEHTQGVYVFPNDNMAGTADIEGQQRHSQPGSSSRRHAQMPIREPGASCEVGWNLQNFHHTPVFRPHLESSWPLPARIGGNFNRFPFKAPRFMGFGSEQRFRWFRPLPFQNVRPQSRGRSFGISSFRPQRFYSGARFMKFTRPARGHPLSRIFGRPPRPIFQHVHACPERPQAMGTLKRSGVSQGGHSHSLGSQPTGVVGRPQPRQACIRGAQLPKTPGKFMRATSHIEDPHPQSFQPAGAIKKLAGPASQQGVQQKTQGRPSNPASQTGTHPMSKSAQFECNESNQSKPSQARSFYSKPSHPVPSQPKPSPTKAPQPQSSQAKPSPSRSTQSKTSQPRPSQPNSSRTSPSQAKTYHPKVGPKRGAKH